MKELYTEIMKTIGEFTILIVIVLLVLVNIKVERKQTFTEALKGESHLEITAEASDIMESIIEAIED